MSTINANMTPMRVCWIFGVPALFTPYRVSRQTVHFGLYQYDMQALLDSPNEVFVLAEQAEDLFYGTVLTTQKIEKSVAPTKREIDPPLKVTFQDDELRPYFPEKGTTVATVKRTMFEAMDLRKRALERQKAKTQAENDGKKRSEPAR